MTEDAGLAPISDADWPEDIADLLPGFAGALNVYRTMATHPALLRAWCDLREHVVNQTALGRQRAEIVILRAGVRLRSDYEWSQHVLRARSFGLDDARIASIKGDIGGMQAQDAVLAQAVDDLFDIKRLSEASRNALTDLVGKEGVLDLMATVGFYSTLGFILNTFEVPLDADAVHALEKAPLKSI